MVLAGIGVGVVVSSAVALWLHEQPAASVRAAQRAADPILRGKPKDIAALEAEVQRLKGETADDLTALRSQLARMNRDQEANDDKINRIADQIDMADFAGSAAPAGDEEADAIPLTPEEEREREAVRTRAEIDLRVETSLFLTQKGCSHRLINLLSARSTSSPSSPFVVPCVRFVQQQFPLAGRRFRRAERRFAHASPRSEP